MHLLADYEGLGVAIASFIWLVLTVLALLAGAAGVLLAIRRRVRPVFVKCVGAAALLMELVGIALVWLTFLDERTRLGEYAERFRPGAAFWSIAAVTLALACTPFFLDGGQPQPRKKDLSSTPPNDAAS